MPSAAPALAAPFIALTLLLAAAAVAADAPDPCAAFSWDVRQERALFAASPTMLAAGQTLAAAAVLVPGRMYELTLSPQSQVSFAVPPGGHHQLEGAHAGLARLTLPAGGLYRISLDQPAWVDVLANGAAIQSRDFQGRPGCNAPHKVVEFLLPAATPLTLQFSASAAARVRVSVTRSPQPPT